MSKKIESDTNQRNADNKSDQGGPMVTDINGIKSNEHNNQTTDKINKNTKPEKKGVSWLKRPATEWILAFATIVICIMTVLQWLALRKTDQTSRLRDRAYVYFSNPIITPYPPKQHAVWAIGINMVNVGNMPARRISVRCGWIDSQASNNIIDPFPLAKWSEVNVPKFIGPKQSLILQGCEIPIGIIEQAKKNKVNIFVLMEVRYTDGFDINKSRVTQMSRSLRFDVHGGQSWGFAGPHNCTDDDCN